MITPPGPSPSEQLFCELVSVSPLPAPELAVRAAAVLDGAGALAPDRGGFSSRTARLRGGGLRALVDGEGNRPPPAGWWIVFERRERGLWGDLRVFPDLGLDTAPRPHHAGFVLPVASDFAADAQTREVVGLFGDLFVAMRGFFGCVDTVAMRSRRLGLRTRAADAGTMWIPRWEDPTFLIWDRWVEDVWWINLFGPAYVERWGRDAVERMGVRRETLRAGGGVAIWASELPPDPRASRTLAGYPHKKSFYDAVGIETFVHESLEIPAPGERVPTLHDHARASG